MKQYLANHLKNIKGKKTQRKLLAFSVDDYGNIRLASLKARENLLKIGVKLNGRFDYYDALDTREDYEMLFEVLGSFKDKNGNPVLFTPYALPCNIDFQKTKEKGYYIPENLDVTYKKNEVENKAFEGAFELLLEGINHKLIKPQFHGREHLNVNLFNALLEDANPNLLANLENYSLAGVPNHSSFPKVEFNQAFAFWKEKETELHKEIIRDGLNQFKLLYGYDSKTFTPPAMQIHPHLNQFVSDMGIEGLDKNRVDSIHLGEGNFIKEKSILGESITTTTLKIVRNCVFEPNDRNIDWVGFTFKQIEAAFFWNKPAIVSSHRVNFCGHIDPENRKKGLTALKALLDKVVKKWPDVEFVSVDKLIQIIENDK